MFPFLITRHCSSKRLFEEMTFGTSFFPNLVTLDLVQSFLYFFLTNFVPNIDFQHMKYFNGHCNLPCSILWYHLGCCKFFQIFSSSFRFFQILSDSNTEIFCTYNSYNHARYLMMTVCESVLLIFFRCHDISQSPYFFPEISSLHHMIFM